MSMPSCIRPQRQPNPLTTGPETGQTNPAADGPPEGTGDSAWAVDACAVSIWLASWALTASRAAASLA